MKRVLAYGSDHQLELEIADSTLVVALEPPRISARTSLGEQIRASLKQPLDFPPLVQATVPGDRIVLPVGAGVPRADEVTGTVIEVLIQGGTDPCKITVLLPEADPDVSEPASSEAICGGLPPEVSCVTHDSKDQTGLAYLATSKENKPIYVNRHMADADLVLPIGCLRPSGSIGYCGLHSSWFPAFSDAATQQRYLAPTSSLSSVQHGRRCVEADEAAWLLGIQMVLEIVPGRGETVHRVLAGTPATVADQGRRVCDEAWRLRIPQRVDLVIAAIEGDHREQSWENFARALAVALEAVEDGGAILLCTDLRCPPGESLLRLVRQEGDAETIRQLQRDRGPDATSASLLCSAFDRAQVFLISAHEPSIVEDLGIGYVAGHDEAQRLVRQFKSCLLIPDAQRAGVQVTGDSE